MARLTRITGKIFGETATSTGDDPQIGQFGSALAGTYVGTTDVATIQSLPAWSNGFIDAVTASNQYPPLPEMTGFGKVLSYQQNYLMQQGIPEWDSGTTYYTNNFCSKGTKIFYSLTDSNLNNDPAVDSINWKEFTSGSSRNIGEIVTSTIPLVDAGLHLLDGTLLDGNGAYGAFVDYISELITDYPDLFETEANWQTSVTNYGVCGKFVYDSVNNTVRLPKVTGFVEGTTDLTALGNLVEAGLPNITGVFGSIHSTDNAYPYTSGALYNGGSGSGGGYSGTDSHSVKTIGFDASYSNSIYGNSATVQPQAVKVLYYIVIATTEKTEIEVDIDDIATDLNGKADIDLSNTTGSLSNIFLNKLIPDYSSAIDITSTISTSSTQDRSYSYPFMLQFWASSTSISGGNVTFECNGYQMASNGYSYNADVVTVFVGANETFKLYNNSIAPSGQYAAVIPLKGGNYA